MGHFCSVNSQHRQIICLIYCRFSLVKVRVRRLISGESWFLGVCIMLLLIHGHMVYCRKDMHVVSML